MFNKSVVNIKIMSGQLLLPEEIDLGYSIIAELEELEEYDEKKDIHIHSVLTDFSYNHLELSATDVSEDNKTKTVKFKDLNIEERIKILTELVNRGLFNELKIKIQKI